MIRLVATVLLPLGLILTAITPALSGEFEFTVKVDLNDRPDSTKENVNSTKERLETIHETVETPTTKKLRPRQVVKLTCNKPIDVSWHAENTSETEEFKDVLVHFFVVKEEKTGQTEIPKLTKDVTYEGALNMDFKPHDDADWQWTLNIHEPGSYLLRVETIGMQNQHGHDHYAAMDLVVMDAATDPTTEEKE
jgi:hypothetical protein